MHRRPHECRVVEWAELVGERVPDVDSLFDADPSAFTAADDAPGDEGR